MLPPKTIILDRTLLSFLPWKYLLENNLIDSKGQKGFVLGISGVLRRHPVPKWNYWECRILWRPILYDVLKLKKCLHCSKQVDYWHVTAHQNTYLHFKLYLNNYYAFHASINLHQTMVHQTCQVLTYWMSETIAKNEWDKPQLREMCWYAIYYFKNLLQSQKIAHDYIGIVLNWL